MGYYCTVPQCTSLAGKTKNVKFHRFPRDLTMADKWNNILKRGKPFTKYSKVCSLHFTQADYNVTTMGQWKTLSKDAVPSQNLPRLNPDGSVMVIRKSRTVKREIKREDSMDRSEKFSPLSLPPPAHIGAMDSVSEIHESHLAYRLHNLNTLANAISPHQSLIPPSNLPPHMKPKKQDAIMQTDPIQDDNNLNEYNSDDNSQKSFESAAEKFQEQYPKGYSKDGDQDQQSYHQDNKVDLPKDYTKSTEYSKSSDYSKSNDDYIPQTNDEYNKEAEKYALERKRINYDKHDSTYQKHHYDKNDNAYQKTQYDKIENYTKNHDSYSKVDDYQKAESYKHDNGYQKSHDYDKVDNGLKTSEGYAINYGDKQDLQRDGYISYQNSYPDPADLLRSQQHNLQLLHDQREDTPFYSQGGIKQEADLAVEDAYERAKERIDFAGRQQQRLMDHLQHTLKQEPEHTTGQPQGSPYYTNAHSNMPGGYYEPLPRSPGPELLIAKQNALAAHTQLWQNTMKRPFYYSENPHYNTAPPIIHRYEESLSRILQ